MKEKMYHCFNSENEMAYVIKIHLKYLSSAVIYRYTGNEKCLVIHVSKVQIKRNFNDYFFLNTYFKTMRMVPFYSHLAVKVYL